MQEVRQNNSKTLRTQKLLSNKYVLTGFIALIDILFLLAFNVIFNFIEDIGNQIYFASSGSGLSYSLDFGFYTGRYALYSYLIYLIFIIFLDAVTVYRFYVSYAETDINVGQKGTQRWTTSEEIKEQYKEIPDRNDRYPGNPGTIISRIGNKLYIDTDPVNTLYEGISRSGKGEMFVFPSIDVNSRAEKQPSMIIADPKIELYRSAKKTLEERGYEVHLLNLDNPTDGMGYNPLDATIYYAKQNESGKAMDTARAFAFSIFHATADRSEPIWANTATDLFTALILAHVTDLLYEDEILNNNRYKVFRQKQKIYERLPEEEQRIAGKEYRKYISDGDDIVSDHITAIPTDTLFWYKNDNEKKINIFSIINLFTNLVRLRDPDNPNITQLDYYFNQRPDMDVAKMKYATIETSSDRTRGSIYTNMLSYLGAFIDENIAKMTAESSINLKDIGFGKKPIAIFLGIPDYDKSKHYLASTFIRQVYYINVQHATRRNGKCDRQIRFILDEFGNMPPVEAMEELITVGAGRGLIFDLYVQSIEQLKKVYKDEGTIIKENCANKIFIKATDENSINEFMKMIGNETILDVQRTGERFSTDKHIMETPTEKPLLDFNQLKNLRRGECVVDRSLKRQDNHGNDIIPFPIFNSIESGKRMLYRYEYLQDTFPDPDTIILQVDESRKHINLSERVMNYETVITSNFRNRSGSGTKKIKDLQNYLYINDLLKDALGNDYINEFNLTDNISIPQLISFVSNNAYIPDNKKSAILAMLESEVA